MKFFIATYTNSKTLYAGVMRQKAGIAKPTFRMISAENSDDAKNKLYKYIENLDRESGSIIAVTQLEITECIE